MDLSHEGRARCWADGHRMPFCHYKIWESFQMIRASDEWEGAGRNERVNQPWADWDEGGFSSTPIAVLSSPGERTECEPNVSFQRGGNFNQCGQGAEFAFLNLWPQTRTLLYSQGLGQGWVSITRMTKLRKKNGRALYNFPGIKLLFYEKLLARSIITVKLLHLQRLKGPHLSELRKINEARTLRRL